MTDDRLITAIGRLERALSRIEARSAPAPDREHAAAALADLEQRHHRLRARTQAALERLDRLIGDSGEQGGNGALGGS